MSTHESSLPDPWVERIFAAMRSTYGAAFDRQWECPPGADPVEHGKQLKAHWGRELRAYQQSPQAIRFALENLPERPPNLDEFRGLMRRAQMPELKALPAPVGKPSPEVLAKVAAVAHRVETDPRAWAIRLARREAQQQGKGLTLSMRQMWRTALHVPADATPADVLTELRPAAKPACAP